MSGGGGLCSGRRYAPRASQQVAQEFHLGRSEASKGNDNQRVAPPQARATLGEMGAQHQGAL